MRNALIIVIVLVMAAGCGGSKTPGSMAGNNAAQHLDDSKFDSVKDPPFTADTRFACGLLAENQGQPQQAVDQYQEALKIDSHHEKSMFRLAVMYTQTKQYPQAIDMWKRYVKQTKSASAWSNLGLCLQLAGKIDEAESAYRSGIEKDPQCQPCRVNYGLMLVQLNRVDEATGQLSAVLSPAEVHYNIGSQFEKMSHKDQARTEYRKALELNPQFWEAQSRLAKLD